MPAIRSSPANVDRGDRGRIPGVYERFFQPINQLSQLYQTMQGAMAGAERIFEILDREPAIQDKPDAIEMPTIKGDVEFGRRHVRVREDPVLKDVSFKVKAGETIALVGPTGAGKTTIINLLARQYEIEHGAILIDGLDIRDVKMASLGARWPWSFRTASCSRSA